MQDIQGQVFKLDEGLDLMVSHNPKTMRHAVYLLLAVNRMKRSLRGGGRELSDAELCSAIMDSMLDGG